MKKLKKVFKQEKSLQNLPFITGEEEYIKKYNKYPDWITDFHKKLPK